MTKREDLKFEIAFYEGIVRERPEYVDALLTLAELYTRNGQHQDGLKVDCTLSRLRAQDPTVHYNLACSYSLCGQLKAAFEALQKSVELGYQDFQHMSQDSDLNNLREDVEYGKRIQAMVKTK